jgi:predicted nucleotidyltransferase
MRFGLQQAVIQKIHAVFANHPQVEKAVLYGSRAKGNYKNGSDIDLTLHGGDDLTVEVLYKIITELDDLHLPHSIDLSLFNDIRDPDVIEHIRRVGIVFYEKSGGGNIVEGSEEFTTIAKRKVELAKSLEAIVPASKQLKRLAATPAMIMPSRRSGPCPLLRDGYV